MFIILIKDQYDKHIRMIHSSGHSAPMPARYRMNIVAICALVALATGGRRSPGHREEGLYYFITDQYYHFLS